MRPRNPQAYNGWNENGWMQSLQIGKIREKMANTERRMVVYKNMFKFKDHTEETQTKNLLTDLMM